MINKANEEENKPASGKTQESGLIDVAKLDVQCHILIKDKDTGETLVNKRG